MLKDFTDISEYSGLKFVHAGKRDGTETVARYSTFSINGNPVDGETFRLGVKCAKDSAANTANSLIVPLLSESELKKFEQSWKSYVAAIPRVSCDSVSVLPTGQSKYSLHTFHDGDKQYQVEYQSGNQATASSSSGHPMAKTRGEQVAEETIQSVDNSYGKGVLFKDYFAISMKYPEHMEAAKEQVRKFVAETVNAERRNVENYLRNFASPHATELLKVLCQALADEIKNGEDYNW